MKAVFAFVVAALCLAVSACQTTSIGATVQKSLPQICAAASTARPVIDVLIANGKLTGSRKAGVEASYASLDGICTNSSGQTAASVLVAATSAYFTISNALKSAQ